MDKKIKFIKSFGKLDIKDGDTIVIKYPYRMSRINFENIKKSFEERIGFKNINIMVLDEGADIGILRKE